MYLRTTKRKNRDVSIVKYYQLANNVWDPDKKHAIANVLYNFGRADRLDREELVRLCNSIARVCGLKVEDPLAEEEEPTQKTTKAGLPRDVKFIGTKNLGIVWVAQALWERLGISSILKKIARKNGAPLCFEQALLAMVANRLDKPDSKLGVWDRWLKTVYLPECQTLKKDEMYEAMDFLQKKKRKLKRPYSLILQIFSIWK